jgi:arylsulfatase A-like enzyme
VPEVSEPVANIDLAPTILDLAGADPCRAARRCRVMDGRSLLGLIRGQAAWPEDRGIAIEFDAGKRARLTLVCRYQGVRTAGDTYIRYTAAADPLTGECRPIDEREHYDLAVDPFQLDNLYPGDPATPPSPIEEEFTLRAERLQDCAGIAGRDPRQSGRPFCE